ncbi:D-alanine--D-alanine ligase B [Pseudovibrio sp. Ad13]|nr:D-alanine--D-alanine ligase B [Pseudovibrio sp. Ad13]
MTEQRKNGPMTERTDLAKIGLTAELIGPLQFPNPIANNNHRQNLQEHSSKLKNHIAVVATNTHDLKETGFGSIETCRFFYDALKEKYQTVTFHEISSISSLNDIVTSRPDLVVLCSKYFLDVSNNTKTWFSDYFSKHAIAFTGSDRNSLEFDSNKGKAKTAIQNHGIATAKFFQACPGQFETEDKLPLFLPLFVKPIDAANGNGIDENSIVRDFESYQSKVKELFESYGADVLVEEVLPGREFTVAIFDDPETDSRSIMPVEIIVPKNEKGDRILGCAAKQQNHELLRTITEPTLSAVSELAGSAFTALGVKSFGRIDIKLDAEGNPNFLEANLVPGMTPDSSYFPRACSLQTGSKLKANRSSAMTHSEVALKIVELGLNRINTLQQVG